MPLHRWGRADVFAAANSDDGLSWPPVCGRCARAVDRGHRRHDARLLAPTAGQRRGLEARQRPDGPLEVYQRPPRPAVSMCCCGRVMFRGECGRSCVEFLE
eukprot:2275658-Rhodomonas_salina.1